MDTATAYAVVCAVALVVAAATLFSGFGLGTLLMPAFALFFPVEIAVAATAVVHLANNIFKLTLIGRWARWSTVAWFGGASAVGAMAGAWALTALTAGATLAEYGLAGRTCRVTVLGLVVGSLVLVFGALEFSARLERVNIPARLVPVGGLLSGFFGGLSGHQGALRSAFLQRAGLTKEQLVGTRAACAVIVDLARLVVYGVTFLAADWAKLREGGGLGLVVAASLAAFAGTAAGARLVKSVTLEFVRRFVGAALLLVGAAMIAGII